MFHYDNHFLNGMVFLVDLLSDFSHNEMFVRLCWLVVVVLIWSPRRSEAHIFPQFLIISAIFMTILQYMIYLETMEVSIYPTNNHIPIGVNFLVDIWEVYIHEYEVYKLDLLIVGLVIWLPRIFAGPIPCVLTLKATLNKYLQPMIYLGTVQNSHVSLKLSSPMWNYIYGNIVTRLQPHQQS